DVYGNGRSEELLGKALSSEWDKVYVASKVGNVVRNGVGMKDWSREHIVRSCEASLKRLKKDVIDLYQLHNPEVRDIQKGDWPENSNQIPLSPQTTTARTRCPLRPCANWCQVPIDSEKLPASLPATPPGLPSGR